MSSSDFPTLVERAHGVACLRPKFIVLPCLLAMLPTSTVLGVGAGAAESWFPIEIPPSLYWPLASLVFLTIFASAAKLLIKEKLEYPYCKREALFTAAELKFMRSLEKAAHSSHRVFGKVRLEDVVSVAGVSGNRRHAARNRVKSRHVDFVICDVETSRLVAGVELDDSSHRTAKAKRIDEFKNRCFEAAGLPLLRFPVASSYSQAAIEGALSAAIGSEGKEQQESGAPAPVV